MKTLARQHLVEFRACDARKIDSARFVAGALRRLCKEAPLTAVRNVSYAFTPYGLTVVCVLKESHLAYHSWPEFNFACLDILVCGDPRRLAPALKKFGKMMGARRQSHRRFNCGERQGRL